MGTETPECGKFDRIRQRTLPIFLENLVRECLRTNKKYYKKELNVTGARNRHKIPNRQFSCVYVLKESALFPLDPLRLCQTFTFNQILYVCMSINGGGGSRYIYINIMIST